MITSTAKIKIFNKPFRQKSSKGEILLGHLNYPYTEFGLLLMGQMHGIIYAYSK